MRTNTHSRSPVPPVFDVNTVILAQEQAFLDAGTDEKINWQKECGYALQAFAGNSYLLDAAKENPESLRAAIVNVAAIGISLNPMLKHAYLVPRKVNDKPSVCLDISYQGLLDLAVESGSIQWGQAKLVHKADTYVNTSVDTKPDHSYTAFGERGDIVGVYCTVKTMVGGDYLTEEMDRNTIEQIKQAAGYQNGPWKKWFGEMCRKAVIKRGSKYWPGHNARLARAVQVLNEHEGNFEKLHDATPSESQSESQSVTALLGDEGVGYQVEGMSVEDWILAAATEDDLNQARDKIRAMPEGSEQARLKQLWLQMRSQMREGNERN